MIYPMLHIVLLSPVYIHDALQHTEMVTENRERLSLKGSLESFVCFHRNTKYKVRGSYLQYVTFILEYSYQSDLSVSPSHAIWSPFVSPFCFDVIFKGQLFFRTCLHFVYLSLPPFHTMFICFSTHCVYKVSQH